MRNLYGTRNKQYFYHFDRNYHHLYNCLISALPADVWQPSWRIEAVCNASRTVSYVCIGKLDLHYLSNVSSPVQRQAIIWTNADLLSIKSQTTYLIDVLFGIQKFSFKKIHFGMSPANSRPFCLGSNDVIWHCMERPLPWSPLTRLCVLAALNSDCIW